MCLVRSDGEVIDGHLRLKAARKLGIKEIPVILCDEWTPAQVKAFRLMVNRSATWADWDEDVPAWEYRRIDPHFIPIPRQRPGDARRFGALQVLVNRAHPNRATSPASAGSPV
jgi:hypothetical protein